ncbi:MAG: M28 family peptidase [Actinomycetota bacterium]
MHEHFDAGRAFHHIEMLARLRRLPGTPGEMEAQEYLAGAGEEMGLPLERQGFTYSTWPLTVFLPMICLGLAALSVIGSVTYLWGTAWTALPGGMLLLAIYGSFRWSGAFERFAASGGRYLSANLVGHVPSSRSKGTILLSAHYDSKSQLMPVVVRAALFMLGFFGAILLGLTLLVVGIMAAAGSDVLGSSAGFWVSLVPALFLVLLVFNFTGNSSPGALDNASGEGVILEVARVLLSHPLENFDVVVASFGCEEVGLVGSIRYLLDHEEELKERPFYMLNFDMPFSPGGRLFLNTGFEVPPRWTSEHINDLARASSEKMGFEIRGIYLPVGAAADHMPWSKHGFEATGFVSAATHVHRSTDDIEKINREALRRTGEVALSVVRLLDQELSAEGSDVTDLSDLSDITS